MDFDIGMFLNIGEDHIGPLEHTDFEDYFSCKLQLMEHCRTAIVNREMDHAQRVLEHARAHAQRVLTFGKLETADLDDDDCWILRDIQKEEQGFTFTTSHGLAQDSWRIRMAGRFNVENALAVIAASILLEIPKEYMHSGLLRARSSGRMELYGSADKNLIAVVDYAHNKLSFEKLFSSIKDEYPDYNIVSIFGCPGKKAFIRRRDLGTVAGQYAKKVYLTAEDPGYEPVEQISKEIAQYVEAQNCPYAMIEDRGEAIKAAMDEAEGKTIFLITGKGNETRQKYGCEYLDCKSDTQYVKEYLAEYDKKHQ